MLTLTTHSLSNSKKNGIRKDHKEWCLPRSLGVITISTEKLNCCLNIPANFNSNLVANLPKDLNQGRLIDRLSDGRNFVN